MKLRAKLLSKLRFKTKEGDRETEITRKEKVLGDLEQKLLKIDEMFLKGDLSKDSYHRLKTSTQKEYQEVEALIHTIRRIFFQNVRKCGA
jgi:hypothetical protein